MSWKQGPPARILSRSPLCHARDTWGQQGNSGASGASPTSTYLWWALRGLVGKCKPVQMTVVTRGSYLALETGEGTGTLMNNMHSAFEGPLP